MDGVRLRAAGTCGTCHSCHGSAQGLDLQPVHPTPLSDHLSDNTGRMEEGWGREGKGGKDREGWKKEEKGGRDAVLGVQKECI